MALRSQIPQVGMGGPTVLPGGTPPYAPPQAAPTDYLPPQMQLPQFRAQPVGLGRMPNMQNQMLSSVLRPFGQPNWGLGQVNPSFLTNQYPLAGGAWPGGGNYQPPPQINPQLGATLMGGGLGLNPRFTIPGKVPMGIGAA